MSPANKITIKLSEVAREDIHAIAEYGLQKWGDKQAKSYQQLLLKGLLYLQNYPLAGVLIADHGHAVALRRWPVQRHVVIYRVENKRIHVLRVLHSKMNMTQHLTH